MSGKHINELTVAELRYECRQRGLLDGGAKDALEIRLSQHFADMDLQANAVRFQPMETIGQTGSGSDSSQAHHASPYETAADNRTDTHQPQNTTNAPPTPHNQQLTDMIRRGRDIIHEAQRSATPPPRADSLESRLAMLESCRIRFGDDQRRIAETMRSLEIGVSQQAPERQPEASSPYRLHSTMLSGQHRNTPEISATDNTRAHTHTHTNTSTITDHRTSSDHVPGRSVRFENTACHHNVPTPSHTYEPHQSILIPYDDVRIARFSLPEFHGTTPEDPQERTTAETNIQQAAELLERSQQLLRAASLEEAINTTTAARVMRMPTEQLQRDLVLWAAYTRGWEDRTAVFRRATSGDPTTAIRLNRSRSPRQASRLAATTRSDRRAHPAVTPRLHRQQMQPPAPAPRPNTTRPTPTTAEHPPSPPTQTPNAATTTPTTVPVPLNVRQRRNQQRMRDHRARQQCFQQHRLEKPKILISF
ncbi:hypothetical protein AGLY_017807 [Aphis glycines]|uniref:SAP domain-containing protein n=1 Tax=Aphis glycines TaxID=307491 RepID=A0A6G0SUZ3_APHGL|nr:hypothetical protein AGLY_017807 [Aphis glycines]